MSNHRTTGTTVPSDPPLDNLQPAVDGGCEAHVTDVLLAPLAHDEQRVASEGLTVAVPLLQPDGPDQKRRAQAFAVEMEHMVILVENLVTAAKTSVTIEQFLHWRTVAGHLIAKMERLARWSAKLVVTVGAVLLFMLSSDGVRDRTKLSNAVADNVIIARSARGE